jgi:hypothetical protein
LLTWRHRCFGDGPRRRGVRSGLGMETLSIGRGALTARILSWKLPAAGCATASPCAVPRCG